MMRVMVEIAAGWRVRATTAATLSGLDGGTHAARAAVVLGIDTGLQRTGYAFLSDAGTGERIHLIEAGVIRLRAADALEHRLAELQASLADLLRTHHPDVLACEALYAHYKHPRTAILMGHARGVVLALAATANIEVINVAATNVKKLVTGNGHAGKVQMQRAVAAALGLPRLPEPNDVADALGIALCGLRLREAAARTTKESEKVIT